MKRVLLRHLTPGNSVKYLNCVWLLFFVLASASGRALSTTVETDCSGSFYDSKADLIRHASMKFAVGPVQQGQKESVFVEISNQVFGLGECLGSEAGNVTCKVASRSADNSLPASLSFNRFSGSISFEEESGYKGQIQCNPAYSFLIAERFSWVHKPKAPGDKAAFTVQVRQDRVTDVDECRAQIYGLKGGRRVMGVSFDSCSVVPYENNTKILHFSAIAPDEFVEGAEYYIHNFGARNKGDYWGSMLRGWALSPFPSHD
jgi:hypothetical protein